MLICQNIFSGYVNSQVNSTDLKEYHNSCKEFGCFLLNLLDKTCQVSRHQHQDVCLMQVVVNKY